MVGFIFGGEGMPKTPQELEQMRMMARSMMRGSRTPQNVGEGIASFGDAIAMRMMMNKANKAETAGLEKAESAFSSLFDTPDVAPSDTAAVPPVDTSADVVQPTISSPQDAVDAAPMKPLTGDLAATEAYIRQAAQKRGIDPDKAVRVARSEGLAPGVWQSRVKKGDMFEPSFGPFQMLVGDGKNFPKGMGNDFQNRTGLDPRDPKNVNAMIDFALDRAKEDGWRQWYGAKKVGINRWDGINANEVASVDPEVPANAMLPQQQEAVPVVPVPEGFQQPDPLATAAKPSVEVADNSDYFPPAPRKKVAQALGKLDTMKAMEVMNDPFLPPARKAVLGALIKQQLENENLEREQQLKQADPKYKLDLEKGKLELEELRNPRIKPADQARIDIERQKLADEQKARTTLSASEQAKLDLERQKFEWEKTKKPETIQKYEYYKQLTEEVGGKPLGPLEWEQALRKSSASQTNVDTGTIPAGYRANRDENGRVVSIEPIPGSTQAQDAAAAKAKADLNKSQVTLKGDIVSQDIDRALATLDAGGLPSTGLGSLLSSVPGTNAKSLSTLLDTVKANVSFDTLNQMRQASPTGGALGSVTENELKMLQSTLGSLEQSQDDKMLKDNLNRVWNVYQDIVHGPGKGPERRELSFTKAKKPVVVDGFTIEEVD